MLSKEISEKVLTVGCAYDPPKGGVAQVMYTYSREVYPVFHCIVNSDEGGRLSKLWQMFTAIVKMFFKLSLDKKLSIVHIHTASYNSFRRSVIFVEVAKMMKRKVIVHIHGGGFRKFYLTRPEWIYKKLQKADCIIALTDDWKSYFQNELQLPNVVTVNNIVPNPKLKELNSDGLLHLLFLGAINDQKGIFDLLQVIVEQKEKWSGKLLLHVGGNQEVTRLKKSIIEYSLENIVVYEGWVSGDKKIGLLNQCDAFILPSYVEGLPISILESLSYGKPVITTPVGGIPEVVDESNGFLFQPGDKQALTKIINGIVQNPKSLENKSICAKLSVENNSPNRIVKVLNDVYRALLN